jgi:hypothetical protein
VAFAETAETKQIFLTINNHSTILKIENFEFDLYCFIHKHKALGILRNSKFPDPRFASMAPAQTPVAALPNSAAKCITRAYATHMCVLRPETPVLPPVCTEVHHTVELRRTPLRRQAARREQNQTRVYEPHNRRVQLEVHHGASNVSSRPRHLTICTASFSQYVGARAKSFATLCPVPLPRAGVGE